jgi:Zn-finger nucleic acid-binding protein
MSDELTCPKCQGPMRRYERNGIHIDQCRECRGVFLDRGELEHLIDAEASFTQSQQGSQPPSSSGTAGWSRPPEPSHDRDRRDHGYGDRGYGGGHRPRRRKSFLEELFD